MSDELPPDVAFFKVDVKEYNDIDAEIAELNSKIKPLNSRIKELKAKKSELQGNICEFMSKNKIDQCNVSGLEKIPSKKLSSLSGNPSSMPSSKPLMPLPPLESELGSTSRSVKDDDEVSISTTTTSVKLMYKASKTIKPVNKEFIRTQCLKFFPEKAKSEEFRRLNDTDKGVYLFDYLYSSEDREVVEKPLLKKIAF